MPHEDTNFLKLRHDPGTYIWRFMDLEKFIYLLARQNLYFPRVDRFMDPFEGSLLLRNRTRRLAGLPPVPNYLTADEDEQVTKDLRKIVYISCWHINEVQSAAMWSLYTTEGKGIAVRSTIQRLRDSYDQAKEVIWSGEVSYLNYQEETRAMNEAIGIIPYFHKRKSFVHEREFRALTTGNYTVQQVIDSVRQKRQNEFRTEEGIPISIDLTKLIDRVFVSPLTESWVLDVIKSIIGKYGLKAEVKFSDLYSSDSAIF